MSAVNPTNPTDPVNLTKTPDGPNAPPPVRERGAEESRERPAAALARDLRTVRVLWRREMIRFGRNRLRIAMGLLTPLMFLFILGTGLNAALGSGGTAFQDYRAYLFPGVLVMSVQAPALAVGSSIVWDRQAGFLRQMLVAPVRRSALLAGTSLGGATSGACYGALVLALAGSVGIPYHPRLLLALLELALIAFAFTALGVVAAVCIKRIETFQIAVSLAMGPLLFLSGAMFAVGGLPGWLGIVVRLNPVTYGVDALRRTLPGNLDLGGTAKGPQWGEWTPPVLLEAGGVLLLALFALAVATRRFSRAD
ncbi:ABC transporter permease [Streptomyces sp. MST-110588]|nr:ABC transporter permease [Streptomyces sp. MST-110588]